MPASAGGGVTFGTAYYDTLRGTRKRFFERFPLACFILLSTGVLLYTTPLSSAQLTPVVPVRATGLQTGGLPRFTGEYVSILADVNGTVAASFFQSDIGSLGYVRSSSPFGHSWPLDVIYPDTEGNVGMWTSLAKLSNGVPVIAYQDNSYESKYCQIET